MLRRLAALAWVVAACGRDGGVPDDQLGGLVLEPPPPAKVDVARAAVDAEELSRALAQPGGAMVAALGPFTAKLHGTTTVVEDGKPVDEQDEQDELIEDSALELGTAGSFHGVYTNSKDYGRETIYAGGTLYLRPRYQRWHARAPETEDEPAELRDGYVAAIAATWDLVAPGAELTDRGVVQVAGRDGRKIEVALAPTPRPNPHEELTQRRWREARTVERLTGTVVLDAESGVPLAVQLAGEVGFARDGQRYVMKLALDAKVTARGAVAIAAPPEDERVATPERKREVDERDYLLEGIAPPIRKNADGTAATPQVKLRGKPAAKAPPAKAPAKAPPAKEPG